jgi:hypothetical protein
MQVLLATCFHAGFVLSLFFDREDVPPKCRLTLIGLHGVISHKIELFITTTVKISNPTKSIVTNFFGHSSSCFLFKNNVLETGLSLSSGKRLFSSA